MSEDLPIETGEVRLHGKLTCRSHEQLARVLAHLPEHIRLTRAEAGCLKFEITQGADPMEFWVNEAFASEADFRYHSERTRKSDWWATTSDIERDFQILKA